MIDTIPLKILLYVSMAISMAALFFITEATLCAVVRTGSRKQTDVSLASNENERDLCEINTKGQLKSILTP